jgi:mRNA interferase RelE/StbE
LSFELLFDPRAAKALKKIDQVNKTRIKNVIGELATDPYKAGKPIHPSDYWKIKSGDYRIIYLIEYEPQKVVIVFIGHRKNVYDNFANLLY